MLKKLAVANEIARTGLVVTIAALSSGSPPPPPLDCGQDDSTTGLTTCRCDSQSTHRQACPTYVCLFILDFLLHLASDSASNTSRRMVHLWSGYTAAAVLVMSVVAVQTHGANVVFKNQCEYAIDVYDNSNICTVGPGSRASPTFGCGREIPGTTMYRHKESPEATLAEFAYGSGKAWYDISIIPPGPDNCGSLSDCQQHTGKTGFNVPVMILPTKYLNAADFRCRRIMCHYDGCPDAFHFPKDNEKVYNCPQDEQFQVIYCP